MSNKGHKLKLVRLPERKPRVARRYMVTIQELPNGVSVEKFRGYIQEAVNEWWKTLANGPDIGKQILYVKSIPNKGKSNE